MAPLYNVFCEVTGLGGRAIQISENNDQAVASDRVVSIRFDATVNSSLPWNFKAKDRVSDYNLGVPSQAFYVATNPHDDTITGQATYNVSPAEASLYFVKTECFCFTKQTLGPNEKPRYAGLFLYQTGFTRTHKGHNLVLHVLPAWL